MTPRHSRWLTPIAVAAALLAASQPATAQSSGASVIVAAGEASMTADVRAAAQEWLKARGWTVTDGGLSKRAATKLAQCLAVDADECVASIADLAVDRVWFFLIETEPADAGTNVELVLRAFGRNGHVLASERKYCERCRAETLRARVAEALEVVSRATIAQTAARTVLRIRSVPPGAVITVDGQQIGTTDREYSVYPGRHSVKLRKPGYLDVARDVEIREGEVKSVDVALTPDPAKPPPSKPPVQPAVSTRPRVTPTGSRPWPYVVGGAGVVLTASGVTLLALHDPKRIDGVEQHTLRDTLVPGMVLSISGAVALGVGTYLLLRPQPRPRVESTNGIFVKPTVMPIVTLWPSGIGLGFSGGF